MSVTLFKRYRMVFNLTRELPPLIGLTADDSFLAWRPELLQSHAETKFKSFCDEMDTSIFSCLGRRDGCQRLMADIVGRAGFLPEATWLLIHRTNRGTIESCGTIQAVQSGPLMATIQNIGIVPKHRGRGLGAALINKSLLGMQGLGFKQGTLEVTAHNLGAIRLYQRMGFVIDRVVYKSAEIAII
jgi:ribosomal protein S18 acetylase RimI-like enzyme